MDFADVPPLTAAQIERGFAARDLVVRRFRLSEVVWRDRERRARARMLAKRPRGMTVACLDELALLLLRHCDPDDEEGHEEAAIRVFEIISRHRPA